MSSRCPDCGAVIPEGILQGQCAACLLGMVLEPAEPEEAGRGDAGTELRPVFGNFEILGEISHGGMGVVYRAHERSLNRVVALKTIVSAHAGSPEFVERFHQEVRIAARLEHPNIVPVYQTGDADGVCYVAMKYIDGPSLAQELLRRRRAGEEVGFGERAAAALMAKVARAVHAAHRRGVIHRDLKPGNILLDGEGEPHVVDFGLAVIQGVVEAGTMNPAPGFGGTPAYMAPEQARGESEGGTTSSDIFALGAILYELVTGQPWIRSKDPAEALRLAQEATPPRPSAVRPGVSADLEAICVRAMQRDPAGRYASAWEMADDLGRFLEGKAVRARPLGRRERTWRWARQNPWVAGLLALVVLLLAGFLIGSPLAMRRIQVARRHAEGALRQVELQQVRERLASGDAAAAISGLASMVRRDPGDVLAAEWLINELSHRSLALPVRAPFRHPAAARFVDYTGDGAYLLSAADDNVARVWEVATGRATELRHDREAAGRGVSLGARYPLFAAFSPGGGRVVTASVDGRARVWETATGRPLTGWLEHGDLVAHAAFSPDETRVVTACRDGGVRQWEVTTGEAIGAVMRHGGWVNWVAYSPDGRWIASGADDRTARLWEARTGEARGRPLMHGDLVRVAAFSPDGRRLLTVSSDATARVWEVADGRPVTPPLRHRAQVVSGVFSPDGRWVATASFDHTAQVWEVEGGTLQCRPLPHHAQVRAVAFSPDGLRVATGSEDHTARVWSVLTGEPLTEAIRHGGAVWSVLFNPDGRSLATASTDGMVRVWDIRPGAMVSPILRTGGKAKAVRWNADRGAVAILTRVMTVWDAVSGRVLRRFEPDADETPLCFDWSRDEAVVVMGMRQGHARVWDLRSREPRTPRLVHGGAVNAVAFWPGAGEVMTASEDGSVWLWQAEGGARVRELWKGTSAVRVAMVSPAGGWMAAGTSGGEVLVGPTDSGQLQSVGDRLGGEVLAMSFSRDGRRVAVGGGNGVCRVWEGREGRWLGAGVRHGGAVLSVDLDREGRLLATGSRDGTARLWEVGTGRPVGEPLPHFGGVLWLRFSPDGERLVTGSEDGKVRLWSREGASLGTVWAVESEAANLVSFGADGRTVLAAFTDRTARLVKVARVEGGCPEWLPELADAVAAFSGAEVLPAGRGVESDFLNLRRLLLTEFESEGSGGWARWFLADRAERPLYQGADWSMGAEIGRRMDQAHVPDPLTLAGLAEALWLRPTQGELYAQAALVLGSDTHTNPPSRRLTVDFWSRQAWRYAPDSLHAAWARAVACELQGNLTGAREWMERGLVAGADHVYFLLAAGRLLERCGSLEASDAAFQRAVDVAERHPGWEEAGRERVREEIRAFRGRRRSGTRPGETVPIEGE